MYQTETIQYESVLLERIRLISDNEIIKVIEFEINGLKIKVEKI